MYRKIYFALLALLPFASFAQRNMVDEIIWVVGEEPILLSDVEEARITAEQQGSPVDNPYCTIPEMLAINKLFLHQAQLDSVEVSEADVIQMVDEQISEYIQTYGSREAVEQIMHVKLSQLREMWKKQARESEMINQVKQSIAGDVKVTPAQVREYYKGMPEDSLPYIPTQVEVQIITYTPQVARAEVERIEARLRDFAQRVNSGETEFATLAKFYSQDGSARNGGELGYAGRNQWVPEFANVAFSLNDPKKVSKIVRTEFGFHILQLIDKRGDKVNVRHILLKPEIDTEELIHGTARLDSIADDIRAGKFTFEAAAQALSDDKDTRNNYGLMANHANRSITSRFEMKDLPADVAKVVDTLQVGQISKAFTMINDKSQTVCAVVRLKNRIDGHRAGLTEDFQTLRNNVVDKRREEKIEEWLKKKISQTYIRISPEWRNCDFRYEGWVK
ncbi:peptidylprolyl isomerase [bacterium]|nr:peptidylprolyl isomerase [bacterium]